MTTESKTKTPTTGTARWAGVSLVRRHPLLSFFVLAYALSWAAIPAWALGFWPNPIFSFGPFLAALVALGLTQGKGGVGGLLRSMVHWRVGLRWYAAAILLPAGLALAATALNVVLGARTPSSDELGGWTGLLPSFFLILLIPDLGGAWEEPGWRGYALPRLQSGRSALLASLILGALWALWHLPLMWVGQVHYSDVTLVIAAAIVSTWLFNGAEGSVLLLMLMHAMNNTVSGGFFSPMFSGADSVRQSWLLAAVWCAVAIVMVVVAGPRHLSRRNKKRVEEQVDAARLAVAMGPAGDGASKGGERQEISGSTGL
jgi:membrane protease YdiL (CAAX protease family)